MPKIPSLLRCTALSYASHTRPCASPSSATYGSPFATSSLFVRNKLSRKQTAGTKGSFFTANPLSFFLSTTTRQGTGAVMINTSGNSLEVDHPASPSQPGILSPDLVLGSLTRCESCGQQLSEELLWRISGIVADGD